MAPPAGLEPATPWLTVRCYYRLSYGGIYNAGTYLSSRAVASQVFLTLKSLTSVFGMGTGGTSLPLAPTISKLNLLWFLFSLLFFLQTSFQHSRKSPRPISTCSLNTSQCLHVRPINLLVFEGSYSFDGISYLKAGFTLRCLQRLSDPHLAAQLCHWRDNWCTRGASIPVLSY